MASLKINELQIIDEMEELSHLEAERILGGGWFKKLFGFSTPQILKDLDDTVREKVPGGWPTVIEVVAESF